MGSLKRGDRGGLGTRRLLREFLPAGEGPTAGSSVLPVTPTGAHEGGSDGPEGGGIRTKVEEVARDLRRGRRGRVLHPVPAVVPRWGEPRRRRFPLLTAVEQDSRGGGRRLPPPFFALLH